MTTTNCLYFMLNPALGIIKIGISNDVEARRVSLEHACGIPLEVLRVEQGGASLEKDLHLAFSESRLRGEWFTPTEDLVALACGGESLPDFLARKAADIALMIEQRDAAAKAEKERRDAEDRAERAAIAQAKAEQRRREQELARRREERRQRAIEEERQEVLEAQAAWQARASDALKERLISPPRMVEATGRRQFIESQRSRNAVLNGVRVANG